MSSISRRVKISTIEPLPIIKAWLLFEHITDNSSTVKDLQIQVQNQLACVQGKEIDLLVEGFLLLPQSKSAVIDWNDSKLVIEVRLAAPSSEQEWPASSTKRIRNDLDPPHLNPSKKLKVDHQQPPLSKNISSDSDDSEESDAESDGSNSSDSSLESDSTSSASSYSSSALSTSSSSSAPCFQSTTKASLAPLRQATSKTGVRPSFPVLLNPKATQNPVPPGEGLKTTHDRNIRRRKRQKALKEVERIQSLAALSEPSPSLSAAVPPLTSTAATSKAAQPDFKIGFTVNSNRNKSKGFKIGMKEIGVKTTFGEGSVTPSTISTPPPAASRSTTSASTEVSISLRNSSSAAPSDLSQVSAAIFPFETSDELPSPQYLQHGNAIGVAPSEKKLIPKNMFVTSYDCETGEEWFTHQIPTATAPTNEDEEVMLNASQPTIFGTKLIWDWSTPTETWLKAESAFDQLLKFTTTPAPPSTATTIVYKELILNPYTYNPELSLRRAVFQPQSSNSGLLRFGALVRREDEEAPLYEDANEDGEDGMQVDGDEEVLFTTAQVNEMDIRIL